MADHPNTFHLVVASVGQTRFDGAAVSVTVPGAAGEMTILPNHEPIVTTLKKGIVRVKGTTGDTEIEIDGGVLECSGAHAVVLL